MMRKEEKTAVIEANRLHETDTGSPEVQIAVLTKRIADLTVRKTTLSVTVLSLKNLVSANNSVKKSQAELASA